MSEKNPLFVRKVLAAAICSIMLAACGSGGGDSDTTTSTSDDTTTNTGTGTTNSDGETISSLTTGIEVPSEISAIPADSTSSGASLMSRLNRISRAQATSELASTSDYAQAIPSIYVEERALEQFDIIEEVFGALAQTNYADEENINQGPYQAVISWKGEQDGKDIKQLQTWTIESRMIVMDLPSDVTSNTTGDVNRLFGWIPERDRMTGEEELIKMELLIYSAPDKADDGSLINYGEWDLNVLMGASPTGVDTIPAEGASKFFAASARIDANGTSTLQVHNRFTEELGGPEGSMTISDEMKGVLVRDGSNGYGKVSYPDWDACFGGGGGGSMDNPCADGIPSNVAQYAYNGNYLGVQEINDGTTADAVYKDRNLQGAIRIVHRYDLFYADADADADAGIAEGDDVQSHLNFGFPVTFEATASEDENVSFEEFAYYGAWQGRHQLWGPGTITATTNGTDGTTLTRQDVRPGQTAPTYKLKEFAGTFTSRSMIDASLNDIKDIAVETFLNDHYDMFYKTDGWYFCDGGFIDWGAMPPICRPKDDPNADLGFTALAGVDGDLGTSDDDPLLAQLAVSDSDRRFVNIGSCNENGCNDYMYLSSDPSVQGFTFTSAGFYPAEWGYQGQQPTAGGTILMPADGMNMWVDIGGSVYITYTGQYSGATTTGWVMKTLESFDNDTWTPTFATNGDSEFTPERGYEYYMHTNGQNYIVTRTGDSTGSADAYNARLELQTAANPSNTDTSNTLLPSGTSYMAMPWNPDVKLELEDDPTSANYLLLVVQSDATSTYNAGDVYTEDTWGLTAFNSSDQPLDATGTALTVDDWGWVDPEANANRTAVQFNYEYAGNDGDNWGKQQFLISMSDSSYIILSDPINLTDVALVDNLGSAVTPNVSLQYDGWMHGLPDMYHQLERNGWSIEGLGEKVRRLTEGQVVSDGVGTRYFVKPMEMSLFLGVVNAFPNGTQPDISAADTVNLDNVPNYTHHEMGAQPTTNADGDPIEVKYSEGNPLDAE
ncbi:MAG: hypothetical protein JKY67_19285 [Pseudomonadales bacterium]|nr:hypothetical protein [Pseudomonadales bacterium]